MRHLPLILALLAAAGCRTANAKSGVLDDETGGGSDCSSGWEVFSSKPYEQIALPDTHVNYWRYRFKLPAGVPLALKVHGTYPRARYMNFNVYDANTQNSSASLADFRIAPDDGGQNPFAPGGDLGASPHDYTVWVVPSAADGEGGGNVVTLPPAAAGGGDRMLELWYRIYLPSDPGAPEGGVPLPTIQAFSGINGTPASCPAHGTVEPSILNALGSLPPENPIGAVYMYRSKATGLYANLDNQYLATRLRVLGGNVVVLRMKPPRFPDTGSGLESLAGSEDVRYWSFCLGGLDQKTSSCLSDADFKPDANGFVTLVIGPDDVKAKAQSRGQTFMPWGTQAFQVLVYRNLLADPEFAGNLAKVKQVDGGGPFSAGEYEAQQFIGMSAPVGAKCLRIRYNIDSCGIH